jgi:ABC-type transport system involved in multi-copper enzyme maturation permease subunit
MSDRNAFGLSPGPVFIYEWVTASRRWQGYALRSVFVLGLLAALLVIAMNRGDAAIAAAPSSFRALAELGERIYVAVVGTQLTLVLLAAPAATAGAICLDRSRGTLTHLLVTDLTDREIVLGKLAARITPVLALVAATLPFMELLTLLGGVDPDALLGAFLVTLGVAALGCSLALVFSIRARRTHEAVMGTYAAWGLWLLATPMIDQINRVIGPYIPTPPPMADPFVLAFSPYWRPSSVGRADFLGFLAVTWGISAVLVLFAVLTMRRTCTREADGRPVRRPRPVAAVVTFTADLASRSFGWPALRRILERSGPSMDFNPVFWREWHRNRPPRWARVVVAAFVAVALTFSVMSIFAGTNQGLRPWVNALQVSTGLLFLSVVAATSLAEERVRGSLDVLMTTPLETREIVIGKWLGTFRLVPPLAILPVFVLLGSLGNRFDRWPSAMLMAMFVLAAGAAVTSLGLAMATWCGRLGRAVGLTVSVYLLVTVGWMFAVLAISNHGVSSESMMMGSPFFWPGEVTHLVLHDGIGSYLGAAVGWTLAYALAAFALLAATLKTFNRCLGRVESRSTLDGPPGAEKKKEVPAGLIEW